MKKKATKSSKTVKKPTGKTNKLSKDFIKTCKKNLLLKYQELIGINKKELNSLFEDIGDEADIALNVLEQEISRELSDTQRTFINLILEALEKIKKGEYGICEKCGEMISKKRLRALPWAKYCIGCQSNIEK